MIELNKFKHFHGQYGQIVGTVAYEYMQDCDMAVIRICKVNPNERIQRKQFYPTKKEGRHLAVNSRHQCSIHKDLLKVYLGGKANELASFCSLWLMSTGKYISQPSDLFLESND